jgi:hypothetical protein
MSATAKARPPKQKARKDDPVNAEYEKKAKDMLKYAMSQGGLDYAGLSKRLAKMGVEISARGIENKISRGGFSSAFLLQCMEALEINVAILPR